MTQTERIASIISALSRGDTRIFRVNNALAWVGTVVRKTRDSITLKDYRPLRAGMVKGGSDCVGWRSVEITPEMVGMRAAIFVALEDKSTNDTTTEEQENFLAAVKGAGGIAGVARNVDEARAILEDWNG